MIQKSTHIPVFLLTGFLGSGKTTLLKRLLDIPCLSDTAILINEFGEVALDHQILNWVGDSTMVLKSGCICCVVKEDLAEAVRDLYSRRTRGLVPSFGRLVIETTGLADPAPIISTFSADMVLRHHFRMAAVIATVDAINGHSTLNTQPESIKQIALADRVVVTKSDISDEDQSRRAVSAIRRINPTVQLVGKRGEEFEIAQLLTVRSDMCPSAFYCEPIRENLSGASYLEHLHNIGSCSINIYGSVEWPLFGLWLTMVLHRHGNNILRVKGIIYPTDVDFPVALHAVQSIVYPPTHLLARADDDQTSKLVFIYRGNYAALILRSLNAFGITSTFA